MSDKKTTLKTCSRCGVAVESCAFCDDPDCRAVICYRCMSVTFLDRSAPKATASSPAPG
jgi:hypothetical protein